MEHRRSWNTSFSPFQVRSAAACRADDIAALAKRCLAKRCLHTSLSHTPSFTHTTLSHTYTYIRTYIIIHTYIRTYIRTYIHTSIHTHSTLSHKTVLTSRSFTTSFVFPSFPVPATTFEAHYWKKLTCGVIRSFNFFFLIFARASFLDGLDVLEIVFVDGCLNEDKAWLFRTYHCSFASFVRVKQYKMNLPYGLPWSSIPWWTRLSSGIQRQAVLDHQVRLHRQGGNEASPKSP